MRELNLASRPFLNPRPVLRVSLMLWVLGLAVAAFNVRLYMKHYAGSGADREREQELQATLESERDAVEELHTELADYDIERQNEQAAFLNAKIAERSFPWSGLFDRLGETMPADVRLNSLSPSFSEKRGSRQAIADDEAMLVIRGEARSSDVVLEFVDALFAHPRFRDPNLNSESLRDSGLLEFGLSVIYQAGSSEEQPAPEGEESAAEPAEEIEAAEASDTPVDDPEAGETEPSETAAPAEVVSE